MKLELRKIGNSRGVILPKAFLQHIAANDSEALEARIEGDTIVMRRIAPIARSGWAEAAQKLADEEPAWPEFGNEDDAGLNW